jgi:hypothetical protein
MANSEEQLYGEEVLEFVRAAADYCSALEHAQEGKLSDLIDQLHRLLSKLYHAATCLPELDSQFEDLGQRFVTEEDYEFIRKKLLTKLGQYDAYEEVFDEGRVEFEDSVGESISEDLADIYQDIKDFILLFEIGTNEVMHEALWECKQSFQTFWGQKVTNVLRPLHGLRYSDEELEENTNNNKGNTNYNNIDTRDWIIRRRQEDFRNT